MQGINKFFIKLLFLIIFAFAAHADNKILSIGDPNAKINIKVFSSLTCPHCAKFHDKIYESLKKDFIDKGIIVFEHHAFPLDLAALNAEIIVRCHKEVDKSFQLLGEIYRKQNQWAVGSDINKINDSIKKIGLESGLDINKMDNCLKNENTQDFILNERIEAQKKFKISSTPTIYINDKKYKDEHNYNSFKKYLEKLL